MKLPRDIGWIARSRDCEGLVDPAIGDRLHPLRDAVTARRRTRFDHADPQGAASTRTVRPLSCFHWESAWTLAAGCETRIALRPFRLDRMRTLTMRADPFRDEAGRTLADFLRSVCAGETRGWAHKRSEAPIGTRDSVQRRCQRSFTSP